MAAKRTAKPRAPAAQRFDPAAARPDKVARAAGLPGEPAG